ncbi:MAG: response regulator transcription factor [Candidatus Binatia bacterium]
MSTQPPSVAPELTPTVHVVDDDPAMRSSLRWLIESVGLPVATYGSAEQFLDEYPPGGPGCLVLDIRMPGMSGLDLQHDLVHRGLGLPVLIITGYAEVPVALRAMKAGAFDFIEKPFSEQTLLDRIRAALAHDDVTRRQRAMRDQVIARLRLLTQRERDVLHRVVAGKSNKVIAAELALSMKTVEVHRARLMDKLKAQSLADLIRFALLAGENEVPSL